ncbi:phage tail sheath subtilisin-like domain-containing protein [Sphingomonas sp. S1-29]|uniref:phage tail sheath subtilisin-like domain-containing protein n=1 Tax=Sphingomonas sp. S1-29 TaxID=2991074 RepID=UPI0022402195|nr:phage tail sheath subtilisin-like domain-containing protein [Sphingomonas sp. S1-29]UZK70317.1 phage tail sheath subtilisin-like domain-containing protein [Sphingomonas sp. S1-29]
MATRPLPDGGLPRVTFEAGPAPVLSPLRTDIAIFIGPARWGPVGVATRIDCWRAYEAVFGGLWAEADTPYAIQGYFDNGGLIAYVLRVAPGALPATGTWLAVETPGAFAPEALGRTRLTIVAATPGRWANELSVRPTYRRGDDDAPLFDFDILLAGRIRERLFAVPAATLEAEVAARSATIRIVPEVAAPIIGAQLGVGPLSRRWAEVPLAGGTEGDAPTRTQYCTALDDAMAEQEPAMTVLPDLHRQFDAEGAAAVLLAASRLSDAKLDRLVIADAPETIENAVDATRWIERFAGDPAVHRALATYHPWIRVNDPLGTSNAPLRTIPPSGHVAGVASSIDRAKGPYVTPANMALEGPVDLSRRPGDVEQGAMNLLGVNALRCQSGRGIVVWGGRMLRTDDASPRFVAHRRLIARLTRALRRVWEPMVFEPNDDMLRYAIARSATTLLAEAFHAGVLKGTRPDEAFRVDIGESLNDAAAREAGRVICEISIAPAVPMEFIHFRVGINAEGNVEMIEQ